MIFPLLAFGWTVEAVLGWLCDPMAPARELDALVGYVIEQWDMATWP